MENHLPPANGRTRNSPHEINSTDYLLSKCINSINKKSKSDIENNVVCLTSSKSTDKKRRFYYKQQNGQSIYLGTEREFNQCLSDYNRGKPTETQIEKESFKNNVCTATVDHIKTQLIEYVDEIKKKKKSDNSALLEDDIYDFLKYLINKTNVDENTFTQILNGAFVIIKDAGGFYRRFKTPDNVIKYTEVVKGVAAHASSHWSKDEQYRLGKGGLSDLTGHAKNSFDLLVGTSILPNFQGNTWFQFEGNPVKDVLSAFLHTVDFINYKFFEVGNVGPFGNSKYSELNDNGPLIVDTCDKLDNCLFDMKTSPILNSEAYWNSEILKISDYKELTNIVYKLGNSTQTSTGLGIRHAITDTKMLRYPETNKSISQILTETLGEIKSNTVLNAKFKSRLNDCNSVLDKIGIRPDELLMNIFDLLHKCIKDGSTISSESSNSRGGSRKSLIYRGRSSKKNGKKTRRLRRMRKTRYTTLL